MTPKPSHRISMAFVQEGGREESVAGEEKELSVKKCP